MSDSLLLDLDGVLVDSFDFWLTLMNECAAASNNYRITADALRETWGDPPDMDAIRYFRPWSGAEVEDFYIERGFALTNAVHVRTATVAAVKRLRDSQGLRVGVVTNCTRRVADLLLAECELRLDCLVTRDDVRYGKPYAEGVLLACSRLGADFASTMYVGDTDVDARAASAAGVKYLHVDHFTNNPHWPFPSNV